VSGEMRICQRHVLAAKSAAAMPQGRQMRKRLRPFGRAMKKHPFVRGQKGVFSMISVPDGTGDIPPV